MNYEIIDKKVIEGETVYWIRVYISTNKEDYEDRIVTYSELLKIQDSE